MQHVVCRAVGVIDAAAEAIAPYAQVVVGISRDRGHAGGAGGHVDLFDLGRLDGKEAVGEGVAHVLLGGEGHARDIVEAAQVGRGETGLVEGLVVEGDLLVADAQGAL